MVCGSNSSVFASTTGSSSGRDEIRVGASGRELGSGSQQRSTKSQKPSLAREEWLGLFYGDLLEHGVAEVSLYEEDRLIYWPMSLHQ